MSILGTSPLKTSGLWRPESLNESLYSKRTRTIWTRDGEIQVPMKKRKNHGMLKGVVSNIWAKDEKGQLLFNDPVGDANTITLGAMYEMMQNLFGAYASQYPSQATNGSSSVSTSNDSQTVNAYYNDGTVNFPKIALINANFYPNITYWFGTDPARAWSTLFGQLWFINGSSSGLTGSHIASSVTTGTGFYAPGLTSWSSNQGWYNSAGQPTSPINTTNTTLSDSFAVTNTGTPQFTHTFTLTASGSALPFTFDGIAWLPFVGYGKTSTYYSAGSYWNNVSGTLTAQTSAPVWASINAAPTSISGLVVSALWNPGYAVTLNPGGSWGFTYGFQG